MKTMFKRSALVASLFALSLGVSANASAATKATGAKAESTKTSTDKPLPPEMIASVDGVGIPKARVDAALKATGQPDTPQLRDLIKNQLIAREVLALAADKQHYEARPEVRAALEEAKAAIFTRVYLSEHLKPAPVTDADVKAKYDTVVGSLGENEYHPRVIAVKDAATAQTVLDQLKKGADFAALARQYSQGPQAAQGGLVGWVSFKTPMTAGNTQNWPQPLAEALVKLPAGGVTSEAVQVGDLFWIVRVDEKRATQIPTFEASKTALRQQLERIALEKATAQVVTDLVKSARIQQ